MSRINLALGEKKVVSISGGRFYYESGNGRIRVKAIGGSAGEFDLSPGMGFQNEDGAQNFSSVEIINISSVALTVDFVITYRELFDNRVTFSNGSEALLVDGATSGKVFTERGDSFLISGSKAPVVNECSVVVLRNPVGSGKKLVVKKVIFSAMDAVAARVVLASTWDFNTYVTEAVADEYINGYWGGVSVDGSNKLLKQGNEPFAGFVAYFSATSPLVINVSKVAELITPSNTPFVFEFSEPYVLYPNAALFLYSANVNQGAFVNFEVFQEAI